MNKAELIDKVAAETNMPKTQAGGAVQAMFDSIASALQSGDDVKIAGFGNFAVAQRAASMGRNPKTGEPMHIPATKTPKFKAGKALKDAVKAA